MHRLRGQRVADAIVRHRWAACFDQAGTWEETTPLYGTGL